MKFLHEEGGSPTVTMLTPEFVARFDTEQEALDAYIEKFHGGSLAYTIVADDYVLVRDGPLVPLTARQLRLILSRYGYLSQVEPALNAIADVSQREEALIEWEYATEYQAENPLISTMRVALDISEADMEAMWREAMTL
ncbi:hypothetical protein [uncultured Cohaesibacter sp.]|uniref:hypothetical protein n=1 Tax=uncultured Cohaesibacter sp. TaxID=1002546 RepID=UPI0029C82113|nr:hypothetical protein [uncultured Cohaesibacter sp.]